MASPRELEELVFKHAVLNAVKHKGRADLKAVLGKVFAEDPSLRARAREVVELAKRIVEEVNERGLAELRSIAEERWPGELEERKREVEEKRLPPLPNVEKYERVVTRFAPNPDFALHLGSARPAILSYEYARMYEGKFILRFEDTDPKTKAPVAEAYEAIREDLRWLGLEWDEEHIQSLRMEAYYEHARRLIELGGAYVCECSVSEMREMRARGVRCEHAEEPVELQLEKWDRMLEGAYGEGEAVLRVKTDISHPDPSVRDWVAFRIIDTSRYPHPLVGDKYVVWPTYNFACGVDDHLMGVTHVLRAKEHITNTVKQRFLYDHFGWEYPETIHFGRLKLEGVVLSKSRMREGIERGLYKGWDDPRLGTLSALRKRGFLPEAVWKIVLDVGIKPSEATISLANLYAANRALLEPIANRYMFVPEPVEVEIACGEEVLVARIPYHPSYPERGFREIRVALEDGRGRIYMPKADLENLAGREVRLLGLANFRLHEERGFFRAAYANDSIEYARERRLPIIQWVPADRCVETEVVVPRGAELIVLRGFSEEEVGRLERDDRIQFYRVGFVRIEEVRESKVLAYFTHD